MLQVSEYPQGLHLEGVWIRRYPTDLRSCRYTDRRYVTTGSRVPFMAAYYRTLASPWVLHQRTCGRTYTLREAG